MMLEKKNAKIQTTKKTQKSKIWNFGSVAPARGERHAEVYRYT